MRDQLGGLVFSTEKGQLCPGCKEAVDSCICDQLADQQRLGELDGIVRIRRETSGRKGKGVTTLSGIPLAEKELKALAKKLKQQCGTGGALKDGIIEIQGDHREKLKQLLEKQGFKVKLAGG
ncbi:translation initiation factor Sui1 [Amphritea balenae]|uniref:Translation initiation factor Sui1 n=1 Tax=Amphritea balenae TaxID=452629 RepID=A0A3P1SW29_9GAMM|nr:translation initiation factor Sui1 [Amphritea balenae]RRD00746.1 translation initiation factor Sui1 [Amphritea balenae]GGK85987.1 translation initiation factor [Amphritea balenae]